VSSSPSAAKKKKKKEREKERNLQPRVCTDSPLYLDRLSIGTLKGLSDFSWLLYFISAKIASYKSSQVNMLRILFITSKEGHSNICVFFFKPLRTLIFNNLFFLICWQGWSLTLGAQANFLCSRTTGTRHHTWLNALIKVVLFCFPDATFLS
jgi:hypothetical protein